MYKRNEVLKGASYNGILLTIVKIVTMSLGLISTRLLSQYLSLYDYGVYSQVQLLVTTVSSFTILGMMDGINYFYCSESDTEKKEDYVATFFSLQMLVSFLAGMVLLCVGGSICSFLGCEDAKDLLVYAAVLPFLQNILSMTQVLILSIGKARTLAIRNLLVSAARLIINVFVITFVHQVAAILFATGILDILQIFLFIFILQKNHCRIRISSTKVVLIKEILKYCIPMAFSVLLNSLNRDCDKYVIAVMTDTKTLAIYTNASKALPIDLISSSFTTVLLPKITQLIAEGKKKLTVKLYRAFLELSYITTGLLAFSTIATASQVIRFLYTEKYSSGLPVFVIYLISDLIRVTNITLLLSASGKVRTLSVIAAVSVAVNLGLNLAFFRLLGISGPAIATLVVTFCTGVAILYFSAKELEARIAEFFDKKFLVLYFLYSVTSCVVLTLVSNRMEMAGVPYMVVLILIFIISCGVGFTLFQKRIFRCLAIIEENGTILLRTEQDG